MNLKNLNLKRVKQIAVIQLFTFQMGGVIAQNNQNTLPQQGNVGIGTTNPRSALDVNGNVLLNGDLTIENMPTTPIDTKKTTYFLTLDVNGKIVAKGMGNMVLADPAPLTICDLSGPGGTPVVNNNPQWFSGPNKIYVPCPDVFVGVSTFNPRTNLDVIGNTYSRRLFLGTADPTGATSVTLPYFRLKAGNMGSNMALPVFLIENATRRLFQIQQDGLVRAREIKVDLDNTWPDYVFQPNYILQPLQEVKTFIAENGHLPNVPKACEVEEDGIALGEMNRILLEKVEELTLYMIQMQEEQSRLKLEIEGLKTKNLGR